MASEGGEVEAFNVEVPKLRPLLSHLGYKALPSHPSREQFRGQLCSSKNSKRLQISEAASETESLLRIPQKRVLGSFCVRKSFSCCIHTYPEDLE